MEAPAGFDTPANRLNPGSGSASNGIVEPSGDTFANDQAFFEKQEDASDGIGPVFNAVSCVNCHANPVTGGAVVIDSTWQMLQPMDAKRVCPARASAEAARAVSRGGAFVARMNCVK